MSLLFGLIDDILSGSPKARGENSPRFAPDSPLVKEAQSLDWRGFSPNSPNSPRPTDSPNVRTEGETAEIWVIAWTPYGEPLTVKAKNAEHAEQISRWNPPPAKAGTLAGITSSTPRMVKCADCRHAQATAHPTLVDCAKGQAARGACGRHWNLDFHLCGEFEA